MNKQFISAALDEYAARKVPECPDLWPQVRQQAATQRTSRVAFRVPVTRLGWAILGALLLLAAATATYASGGIFGDTSIIDPTFKPLVQAPNVSDGLTRSADGYTVTLDRIHADDQRILIGYSIHGQNSQNMAPTDMQLSDGSGTLYKPELGQAVVADKVVQAYAIAFKMPSQAGRRSELKLHLTLNLALTHPGDTPIPMIAGSQQVQVPPRSSWAVAGPFIYDFSVKLSAAQK